MHRVSKKDVLSAWPRSVTLRGGRICGKRSRRGSLLQTSIRSRVFALRKAFHLTDRDPWQITETDDIIAQLMQVCEGLDETDSPFRVLAGRSCAHWKHRVIVQKEQRRAEELGASWARTDAECDTSQMGAGDSLEGVDDADEQIEEIFTAGAVRARQEKITKDPNEEEEEETSADHIQGCIRKHAVADSVSRLLRAFVVLSAVYSFTLSRSSRALLPSSTSDHHAPAQAPWWMCISWVLLADFAAQSLVASSISPWPTFPPQSRKWLLILETILRYILKPGVLVLNHSPNPYASPFAPFCLTFRAKGEAPRLMC